MPPISPSSSKETGYFKRAILTAVIHKYIISVQRRIKSPFHPFQADVLTKQCLVMRVRETPTDCADEIMLTVAPKHHFFLPLPLPLQLRATGTTGQLGVPVQHHAPMEPCRGFASAMAPHMVDQSAVVVGKRPATASLETAQVRSSHPLKKVDLLSALIIKIHTSVTVAI